MIIKKKFFQDFFVWLCIGLASYCFFRGNTFIGSLVTALVVTMYLGFQDQEEVAIYKIKEKLGLNLKELVGENDVTLKNMISQVQLMEKTRIENKDMFDLHQFLVDSIDKTNAHFADTKDIPQDVVVELNRLKQIKESIANFYKDALVNQYSKEQMLEVVGSISEKIAQSVDNIETITNKTNEEKIQEFKERLKDI